MNTAEGRQKMFKVSKQMRKDRIDIVGSNFIKDESGAIRTSKVEVRERWRVYFQALLNEEYESILEEATAVEGPIYDITVEEVRKASSGMKNGKAPGPSGVTSDLMQKAAGYAVQFFELDL